MMIGFKAGGGVDTQARLLAEDLIAREGWNIIPVNVAGKGGATMMTALKDEPNDGLTFGISVDETITYGSQAARNAGYGLEDFTMLSTITGSQVGLFAKSGRGWNTLADVIAAAKSGQKITVGAMTTKLADATYMIGKAAGVEFTTVMVKGGKGGLNGVLADDLDLGWGGGVQTKAVRSGDLVQVVSGEVSSLKASPDAPLLSEYGVPFTFGAKFMVMAPAGLSDAARSAIASAIAAAVNDPTSKVHGFVSKFFSGPETMTGSELDSFMAKEYKDAEALLNASAE